jgi:chromosomal replication initiation ATPase DnaA
MNSYLFNTKLETKRLLATACTITGFTEDEILLGREHRFCLLRYVMYYILRQGGATFQEISKAIGNVHYSTVMGGNKKIQDLIDIDTQVQEIYTQLHHGNSNDK